MAEATSNWPLASWASRRRCFTSVSARRWSASRPCPRLGVGAGDRREGLGVRGGLAGDGQPPGRTLEVEVGLGDLQQRVVGRGPEPGLVRGEDAPRRHGFEDRVGNPQHRGHAVHGRDAGPRRRPLDRIRQRRRSTDEQRATVDRLDLAGDRLDLAIGPIPGRPVEERRQPEARAPGSGRPWPRRFAAGRSRYPGRVAPVSFSALARSIGSTTRPGISVGVDRQAGRRSRRGARVVRGSRPSRAPRPRPAAGLIAGTDAVDVACCRTPGFVCRPSRYAAPPDPSA